MFLIFYSIIMNNLNRNHNNILYCPEGNNYNNITGVIHNYPHELLNQYLIQSTQISFVQSVYLDYFFPPMIINVSFDSNAIKANGYFYYPSSLHNYIKKASEPVKQGEQRLQKYNSIETEPVKNYDKNKKKIPIIDECTESTSSLLEKKKILIDSIKIEDDAIKQIDISEDDYFIDINKAGISNYRKIEK
jgi:hypothetical protein